MTTKYKRKSIVKPKAKSTRKHKTKASMLHFGKTKAQVNNKFKRKVFKRKPASINAKGRYSSALKLVAPNYYTKQSDQTTLGNPSSSSTGIDPSYFVPSTISRVGGIVASNYSTMTFDDCMLIANNILLQDNAVATGQLNLRFHLMESVTNHKITNTCLANINLEAYECTFRQDVPNASGFAQINTILGDGWISAGIADGFFRVELTPFQSPTFTEYIKINKVRKVLIEPGKCQSFRIKDTRSRRIHPGKYIAPTDQTTSYLNAPVLISHLKGSRFILFKFWASPATATGSAATIVVPPGEVMCCTNTRITFKHIQDERINIIETAPIGLGTYSAITTATLVNPLTGVKEVYDQL